MSRFYLTTAIDYSNGDPHLGHTVEKVGADVIARYRRAAGDDVTFVIGMDEHGQKVAQAAEAAGVTPQEWVDEIAETFVSTWAGLDISNDDFIRTTERRHEHGVRALIERIRDNGDFYSAKYEGYYCAGCEAFKKEDELVGGECPLHPQRSIEWTEEENWFFRLSNYRDFLLKHIDEHPDFVRPASRRNEIVSLLEGGLDDISASRSRLSWGVDFPGVDGHSVYVWFDALPNYITAIGYPDDPAFGERWPAALHIIGKDITRFHCVIWPAMLKSAGLELPKTVWAHGFINFSGGKLSKSAGQSLEVPALVERYGPDALRYFLMREIPWDSDRNFGSADDFVAQFDRRYTTDLANDLGNLLSRVVAMVMKFRGGAVPAKVSDGSGLAGDTVRTLADYREQMDDFRLHRGISAALELVRAANGFVDETKPWAAAKAEADGADAAILDGVLGDLVRALGTLAAMFAPFMPRKAGEIWTAVGGDGPPPPFDDLAGALEGLQQVRKGEVLFPRPS
ncbi:MAG: methionine--tRNA ligase [Gemmatimonadota bacterium]